MKKYFASAVVILFIALVVFAYRGSHSAILVAPAPQMQPTATPALRLAPVLTLPQSAPPEKKRVMSGFRDGEYVGKNADAIFGNVRVRAMIRGGKLADIVFEDYPKDKPHSLGLSEQAIPVLTREAIARQNADVDNISGSTQTVDAFRESLKSALAEAS